MPLVYQQNINAFTKLGLWHIKEEEDFFIQQVPLQNNITHPHKRLQHLAGRLLLKELFPFFPLHLIKIADTRKPFLVDEAYHFSISHCADYAAAIVSKDSRVGVDVEVPQEKIERIRFKYLNDFEMELLENLGSRKIEMLTLAWSIKETLFKWYASGNLDFKEHMHILYCSQKDGLYTAECSFRKEEIIHLKVHGLFLNGNCVTWLHTPIN